MKKNNSTTTQRDFAHGKLHQLLRRNPCVWVYATRKGNFSIVKLFAVDRSQRFGDLVDITRDAYFVLFNRFYWADDAMHFQIGVKNTGGIDAGETLVTALSETIFGNDKTIEYKEIN